MFIPLHHTSGSIHYVNPDAVGLVTPNGRGLILHIQGKQLYVIESYEQFLKLIKDAEGVPEETSVFEVTKARRGRKPKNA